MKFKCGKDRHFCGKSPGPIGTEGKGCHIVIAMKPHTRRERKLRMGPGMVVYCSTECRVKGEKSGLSVPFKDVETIKVEVPKEE